MPAKTGEQLREEAASYYHRNKDLLGAHVRASRVLSDNGVKTSARFLTEFARWMRMLGPDGMHELLGCYEGVVVRGEEKAAIPNATSAYLTRLLYDANKLYPNFEIDVRHSKMFEKRETDGQ